MTIRAFGNSAAEDDPLLRNAVRALQRQVGLGVVFGGRVHESDALLLSSLRGTETGALQDLRVLPSAGLGGRVVARRRPSAVEDYFSCTGISHDYDRPVARERLRTMFAVPVTANGSVRMVLYGGIRRVEPFGDRTLRAAMRVAESVGREVAVREEVERRMATVSHGAELRSRQVPPDSADWDAVRAAHAQLRQLAAEVDDPELRQRITSITDGLARRSAPAGGSAPRLSGRELDVLACVSSGCTNAETAQRLQVLPETVKSYLGGAMRKLGVHDRHSAALAARRFGLLP
ncbi:LuxR C-terminal-related transcriptional regulator [Bounagaea algeriensis]